jgi:hypothetical protein
MLVPPGQTAPLAHAAQLPAEPLVPVPQPRQAVPDASVVESGAAHTSGTQSAAESGVAIAACVPVAHAYGALRHADGVAAPVVTVVEPAAHATHALAEEAASEVEYVPRPHGVQA